MRKPEKRTVALDKNMRGGGIIGREYPARRKEAAMVEEEPTCVQEEQTDAVCRVCGRTLWRGPARDAAQKKKAARRSRPSTQNAAK